MKIVLSWVFDHIQSDVTLLDPCDIVTQLSAKTTEIAKTTILKRDFSTLFLLRPIEIREDGILCLDLKSGTEQYLLLPQRSSISVDQNYLAVRESNEKYRWGTYADLGGEKDTFCPPFAKQHEKLDLLIPAEEVVLEIDNNAVSHRPDLWSHRGFAREVAAIFGLALRPLESLIVTKRIVTDPESIPVTYESPFSITIENNKLCKRFAGLSVSSIQNGPSFPTIAARLMLVGCRPIDLLVDYSNYVMYDLGQPIHVYDANKLSHKRIVVRSADAGKTITLLDGEKITLSTEDTVVADGLEPIALAGIMGGADTAVTLTTGALFIESANFQSRSIRATEQRHKKRTDAASRFEKGVDPNQNITAIERYLFLLEESRAVYKAASTIQSVGMIFPPLHISITHTLIEKRLGRMVAPQQVQKILTSLGFELQIQSGTYALVVPTFRCTRDVLLPEDIIEEIGRILGYMSTDFVLPATMTASKDITALTRIRAAKKFLSFGCSMRELYTYIVSDERFLEKIGYKPTHRIALQNPIAATETHLVASLIPNLLRALTEHSDTERELRFYEFGRCFNEDEQGTIQEHAMFSGVFFSKKRQIEFFEGKQYLERLFEMLNVPIRFMPIHKQTAPWEDITASASLLFEEHVVGTCGVLASTLCTKLFEQGNGFYFECSTDILSSNPRLPRLKNYGKYPSAVRDLSLFINKEISAATLKELIQAVDPRIHEVECVDFFEKPEWHNHRSVTFRVTVQDEIKTLLSAEIDSIITSITNALQTKGAEVR